MMILFPNPYSIFLHQIIEIPLKYWVQECVTSKAQTFLIKLVTPFYQKVLEYFVSLVIQILQLFSVLLSIMYLKIQLLDLVLAVSSQEH